MKITSLGFQFLLHSPHAQLWELLLQYLHMAEVWMHVNLDRKEGLTIFKERQMDLIEVLGFLFMLSTMELGRVRILIRNPLILLMHSLRDTPRRILVKPRKPCWKISEITALSGRKRYGVLGVDTAPA